MRFRALALPALLAALTIPAPARAADDARELVKLPEPMQAHMMANMRDHLRAMENILAALAKGDVKAATATAEQRLGVSSLDAHGAAHMAPFMPEPMRAMGTEMHRAASRFVVAAQDAELEPGREAERKVYRALADIAASCNACHRAYRIR